MAKKRPKPDKKPKRDDVDYHTYVQHRDKDGKSDKDIADDINAKTKLKAVKASDVAEARRKWKREHDVCTLLESWTNIDRDVVADALDTGDKAQLAAALREAADQIEA